MGKVKPRDIIEFETTFGRVECHDGEHVWFPRYFGENIAGQINGRKCFVALGFDAPLKYSELKSDYDKLKAENQALWEVFHAAQDVIDCSPMDVEMEDDDQELLDAAAKKHRKALLKLKNLGVTSE